MCKTQVLDNLKVNVSDHLPVNCIVKYRVEKIEQKLSSKQINQNVQWTKVDKETYTSVVEKSMSRIDPDLDNLCAVDIAVRKVNDILDEAAKFAIPNCKKK